MPHFPKRPLVALALIIAAGTAYSVLKNTYLDTSNPLLTNLPHPLHKSHYFASKLNVVNVWFTKKLWAWTTFSFIFLYFTSPASVQYKERLYKYLTASLVWVLFTGWFFGPSLFERVNVSTGGECVLHLPSGDLVSVPSDFCFTKSTVSPSTHPNLFTASLAPPTDGWAQVPRLRRGHDVSGHLFLLTITILFLAEQLSFSFSWLRAIGRNSNNKWSGYHLLAVTVTLIVISLAYFATWTTSLYFHTPQEKITGFLLGLIGYMVTRAPIFEPRLVIPTGPTRS